MIACDLTALADAAVSAHADRPAMTIVHDSADARLVLFRLEPGQQVAPHTSTSTVVLTAISGSGLWSGGAPHDERPAHAGEAVSYAPNELHGMRALSDRFVVLATIAPRPGGRD